MARKAFDLSPNLEHRTAVNGGIEELEHPLRRLEVGSHLQLDALFDRHHQVVAQGRGAILVGDVDIIGNGRDDDRNHGDANHRQTIEQGRQESRSQPS